MAFPDDIVPAYATVTCKFVSIDIDGDDENLTPDVQPLNGTVTLTPTVTAGRISDALVQILTVTARIFGGQIVDAAQTPGVRILATDTDIGIEDWAWTASFTFDSGLRTQPVTFLAPSGQTVSLTSGLIPVTSAPYQVVQGDPGRGITSMSNAGNTITVTYSDATTQQMTFPTVPDTGWRNITTLMPVTLAAGAVYLRRLGNTVWLDLAGVSPTALPTNSWATWNSLIPVGFRVRRNWQYVALPQLSSSSAGGPVRLATDGTVIVYRAKYMDTTVTPNVERNGTVDGLISWTSDNAWPATPYPGSAA